MLQTLTDRRDFTTVGAKTLAIFKTTPDKIYIIQSVTIVFTNSAYAQCMLEWGKPGELYRAIEGVSLPTRITGATSAFHFLGNGHQQVDGKRGEEIAVRGVTNIANETVSVAVQVDIIE